MKRKPIEDAVDELKSNLETVARVSEWAALMEYRKPRTFSSDFRRHYRCNPSDVLKEVRLASIIGMLRTNNKFCWEVALVHSLPDEKALYNYVKRHMNCSPTKIKNMSKKELLSLIDEKLG